MDKVGVVILNYLNYKDTIECVNSLLNDTYFRKEIIIVDNNSENQSKYFLEKYIKSIQRRIYFLTNNKNEGFAKGNNIGIFFARKKLNCKFILLVNNDTVFTDRELIKKLVFAYEPKVGIIGPRIIGKNGYEQNPLELMHFEKDKRKTGIHGRIKEKLKEIYLLYVFFKTLKEYYKSIKNRMIHSRKRFDLVLHGSCMLLTPDYFKYYPGLFPETFLYFEEYILTILTYKVCLYKKFISYGEILHKEDQSSLLSFNNKKEIIGEYVKESRVVADKLMNMKYKDIEMVFDRYISRRRM